MRRLEFKYKGRKCFGNISESGDRTTIINRDGNSVDVFLDHLDWESNPSPIGFLWARKAEDISPLPEKIMTKRPEELKEGESIEWVANPHYVKIEGPRETVGLVHIITSQFLPITKSSEFLTNAPNEDILVALYHHYRPKTWWEKIKAWLLRKGN